MVYSKHENVVDFISQVWSFCFLHMCFYLGILKIQLCSSGWLRYIVVICIVYIVTFVNYDLQMLTYEYVRTMCASLSASTNGVFWNRDSYRRWYSIYRSGPRYRYLLLCVNVNNLANGRMQEYEIRKWLGVLKFEAMSMTALLKRDRIV